MKTINDIHSVYQYLMETYKHLSQLNDRMAPGYLNDIFRHVKSEHLPRYGTNAYRALVLLSDGLPHDIWELWLWVASPAGPRSALQTLTNERDGLLWLIENVNQGGHGVYQLAALHLEGSQSSDAKARLKANGRFLDRSEVIAIAGAKLLPEVTEKKQRFLSDHPEFKYGFGPARPMPDL